MRIGVRILTLVFAIAMLASVPSAMAGEFATTSMGTVQFENETTCPWGWPVYMENLNQTYGSEPWEATGGTSPEADPFNYMVDGAYETDSDYFRVWVDSTDGKWHGEITAMKSDVWSEEMDIMVIDLVVSEVPVEPETFTKFLVSGWNLISLPLTPTDNSVSAVLTGVSQDAVKSYNAATHQFEDATTMTPGTGYFVHVTTAGDWTYEGTAYESMTASLSQGLNMVGWTNTSAALPGALSSIANSYRYVAHWNATSQGYEVYEPNAPVVFNDFTTMERGEGYFIAATEGCTLTSP